MRTLGARRFWLWGPMIPAILFSANAQQRSTVSLQAAVNAALESYPSIRVTQEQMNASAAGIRLAQTAYLPRVDGLAQVNRATRNTFYGMLLPQNIIPGLDGVPSNNLGSVWDSGVGLLVTWQPFDFGLRRANVTTASASHERTLATLNKTRFEVSVATADAFLTVLAAQQTAAAAQAAVASWETLLRSTHAQVAAQLRPGADESRVQAELASARTQLARAEQAVATSRATLAQFAGPQFAGAELAAGTVLDALPAQHPEPSLNVAGNPTALEQKAAITQRESELKALERTYVPQFSVSGVAAARGTGLQTDGTRLGGANGLAPTVQNYGVGLTVTFPVMDRFSIREQEAMQAANVRADKAQYDAIAAQLQAQFDTARAELAGARNIAANTPVERSSAQTALDQATARYKAGLAPIDDVAQAQRLLVQARIDDSLARLNVWRAQLAVASARGDIQPFLAEASH